MILLALFIQLSSLNHPSALASLGDTISSIEADRSRLSGRRSAPETYALYEVHIITNNGVILREYLSNGGKIFAITWQGNTHPDLSHLLGAYFKEFKNLPKRNNRIRGRALNSSLVGKNVTVERSGHLRRARGRAFLPKLIPQGVKLDEIK